MSGRMFTPEDIEHIQASFREAKSPSRQIGILAELYAADKEDIRSVLGLDAAAREGTARKGKPRYSEEYIAGVVKDLRENGLTINAASKKYGVSRPVIRKWMDSAQALPPEPEKVSEPDRPDSAQPPYRVYCMGTLTNGWHRATDEEFPSVEAASRWVLEKALRSSKSLEDMRIVQEHPILPVWEGR